MRRSDRINDTSARHIRQFRCAEITNALRHFGLLARKVGADDLPIITTVCGFPKDIRCKKQGFRIGRMEKQGHGAQNAVLARAYSFGGYALRLPGFFVEFYNPPAVNNVRIQRIGGNVRIFIRAHAHPVAKRNLPTIATAGYTDRPAFLLTAIDPVGELVVGRHMIQLRRRLVVPGTPGFTAVDGDGCALINREDHHIGMFRIDPEAVIIVATGRALEGRPGFATIVGAVGGDIANENHVRIFRMHFYFTKVAAASPESPVGTHQRPTAAAVVAAINAAIGAGIHRCVNSLWIAVRNANADATEPLSGGWQALGQFLPGVATVGGFVQAAIRTGKACVFPGTLAVLPQVGVDGLRILRIVFYLNRAGIFINVQYILPALAAIAGAIDAALLIWAVGMPQPSHENFIRVGRMHNESPDLLHIAQAYMLPVFAAVGRFENAIAHGQVRAVQAFAGSDINNVWLGRRDGDITNGTRWRFIEDRTPGSTIVICFPDTTVVDAHKKDVWLRRNAYGTNRTTRAKGADEAIL